MNAERFQSVAGMTQEQLDQLPFGAIVVDPDGTIRRYNEFEAQISRLDPKRVIGRNFFRDVAPCTAVQTFQGRMREFLESAEQVSITFDYRFAFTHGAVDVAITFIKLATDEVLIAVDRIRAAGVTD